MLACDLNADLGEGIGDDEALLALVTSASIAAGFHAGDPATARATITAAHTRGIAIGAHPSYRDREHFGRRPLSPDPDTLAADVAEQLTHLDALATAVGSRIDYVKPHGALYNTIAVDDAQADAVVAAIVAFRPDIPVLGLPGSVFLRRAEAAGLRPVGEAFADRAYTPEGRLVPRDQPGAVLHDEASVVAHALALVRSGRAESLCVHGDTPGAAALAAAVRGALTEAGVILRPFVHA